MMDHLKLDLFLSPYAYDLLPIMHFLHIIFKINPY